MNASPIRVLVVDDSAFLRKVVSEMLRRSPQIQVVGTARDGRDALEKVAELQPDVVTLDLYMGEMDGVEFLRVQMARRPLPVVLVSIASASGGAVVAAMEAGAVEFVRKPTALALDPVYEIGDELVEKVILAASIPPNKLPVSLPLQNRRAAAQPGMRRPPASFPAPFPKPDLETAVRRPQLPQTPGAGGFDLLAIGVSTGGPQALRYLLPQLPVDFPAAVGIVLHMPPGYTGPLAERLNEVSAIEVREAEEGLEMRPGRAILARAGYHLTVSRAAGALIGARAAHLDLEPADTPHRPAVDVFFRSAAENYGGRVLALVLTGMGSDGTAGAAWIKALGGQVIVEAEETCVVYGMPRSVVEAGLSDKILPIHQMVEAIWEIMQV